MHPLAYVIQGYEAKIYKQRKIECLAIHNTRTDLIMPLMGGRLFTSFFMKVEHHKKLKIHVVKILWKVMTAITEFSSWFAS